MEACRLCLDRLLSLAIGLALAGIFALNLYQVGGRYLFGIGAVWIPDVTRFLFVWMTFLGTALMHQRRKHLVIDFVLLKLSPRWRWAADGLIGFGVLGLSLVLLVVGWRIMQIRMDISYTGWEVPTGYAYLAVPIAAGLIALSSLDTLWSWVRRRGYPRLS